MPQSYNKWELAQRDSHRTGNTKVLSYEQTERQ